MVLEKKGAFQRPRPNTAIPYEDHFIVPVALPLDAAPSKRLRHVFLSPELSFGASAV